MKQIIFILMLLFLAHWSFNNAYGYETAPRISDREIVESLAELKAGQKSLNQRIDDMNQNVNKRLDEMTQNSNKRFEAIDKRFEAIDKRFEAIDKRFDQMSQDFNARFSEMEKDFNGRFEEMNQTFNGRFEEMQNLILTLYASVMALVVALIGYMIWDRKTAQQPLKLRLGKVETDVVLIEDQLEIRNPSGPVVIRLIAALRKLAETDERVAAILRNYSLL